MQGSNTPARARAARWSPKASSAPRLEHTRSLKHTQAAQGHNTKVRARDVEVGARGAQVAALRLPVLWAAFVGRRGKMSSRASPHEVVEMGKGKISDASTAGPFAATPVGSNGGRGSRSRRRSATCMEHGVNVVDASAGIAVSHPFWIISFSRAFFNPAGLKHVALRRRPGSGVASVGGK